jgi:hypothetical protein
MSRKYLIYSLLALVAIVVMGIYVFFPNIWSVVPGGVVPPSTPVSQKVSPETLIPSAPLTSFSGQIEKIENNTLYVSGYITVEQKTQKRLYKVTITNTTTVFTKPPAIPYLFKPAVSVQTKTPVDTKSLQISQTITASASADLRIIQSDTFEASSIEISLNSKPLGGTITDISGSTLKITGHIINPQAPQPAAIKDEQYSIVVSQNTEISKSPTINASGQAENSPEKLLLSDLRVDMNVIVYADSEILPNQTTPALLISALGMIVRATPAPDIFGATPSATPKP